MDGQDGLEAQTPITRGCAGRDGLCVCVCVSPVFVEQGFLSGAHGWLRNCGRYRVRRLSFLGKTPQSQAFLALAEQSLGGPGFEGPFWVAVSPPQVLGDPRPWESCSF